MSIIISYPGCFKKTRVSAGSTPTTNRYLELMGAYNAGRVDVRAMTNDLAVITPVYIPSKMTWNRWQCYVEVAAASSNGKMLFYDINQDTGVPSTLIRASAAFDCSTTGLKTEDWTYTPIPDRWYAAGWVFNNSSINMWVLQPYQAAVLQATSTTDDPQNRWTATSAYTSPPSPWTSTTQASGLAVPRIQVRFA